MKRKAGTFQEFKDYTLAVARGERQVAGEPKVYRARWKLPADYPVVAPRYAAQRSQLARIIQCAPTARNTSGGRFHPENCRQAPVADERLGGVTCRAEAS
jgi:hypothetical protein